MKVKLLSHVRLLATPWTAAYQAPPSMGISRQEYLEWGAIAFSRLSVTKHKRKTNEPSLSEPREAVKNQDSVIL